MAGWSELPAFPDAAPALTRLTDAGLRVACLTNGTAQLTSAFLNRAGLGSSVRRVISAEGGDRRKPAGLVDLYLAAVLDLPADQRWLCADPAWPLPRSRPSG